MPKFLTRQNSNSIARHNYSEPRDYFVSICVENRQQIFGTIVNNQIILNDAGNMINTVLNQIPENYASIDLDKHIVMPNHAHAIIIIRNIVGVDPRIDPNQYIDPV